MRFVFCISLAILIWPILAPISEAQDINLDASSSINTLPRLQKGKRPALLKAKEGIDIEPLSTGLGNISALAFDGKIHLYTADRESGRVWRLTDRDQDGRFESKQALPHRFDSPSGLAVKDDKLYVADKNAIWIVKGSLPPSILAGLRRSGSKGTHHPMALSRNGQRLTLGLTTQSGETKLLSIETETGTSSLIESHITSSAIVALAMAPNDMPWLMTTNSLGMRPSQLKDFHESQNLTGIALPTVNSAWLDDLPNRAILSRQSPNGFDVIALSTNFGQAGSKAESLVSGFLSAPGRTAWGAPSALIFDAKGLILADSFNGDLYRLYYAKPLPDEPKAESPAPIAEEVSENSPSRLPPTSLLTTITGSKIESASSLDAGSNIGVGSTIVRDYKPLSTEGEDPENNTTETEGN